MGAAAIGLLGAGLGAAAGSAEGLGGALFGALAGGAGLYGEAALGESLSGKDPLTAYASYFGEQVIQQGTSLPTLTNAPIFNKNLPAWAGGSSEDQAKSLQQALGFLGSQYSSANAHITSSTPAPQTLGLDQVLNQANAGLQNRPYRMF